MEEFILRKIKELEEGVKKYKKDNPHYTVDDPALTRIWGQIDILYLCITAHNNNYEKDSK